MVKFSSPPYGQLLGANVERYRLAPFCSWKHEGDVLALETPDNNLRLRSDASTLLKQLQEGWVGETPAIRTLAQYGAVIGEETAELRTLRRLERYFSEHGIVINIVRKGATQSEFALPRACYMLKAEPRTKGYGQAGDKYLAMLKAAAEVYERISCDANVNEQLLVTTDEFPVLDVGKFVSYSEWQMASDDFPYGLEPSGKWAKVKNTQTGGSFRLPLEVVCYPDRTGKRRITSTTSSGVACHSSYETALLSSAFELIERDSLMVHWFWGGATRAYSGSRRTRRPRLASEDTGVLVYVLEPYARICTCRASNPQA